MSQLGFVEQVLDNTNQVYGVALNLFEWNKKVQGTKCIVTRVNDDDPYKNIFGTIVSSTLPNDTKITTFNYVVLISMNDMKKLYQKSIEPLQFYDNKDVIKLGDIIIFSRGKQEYKWKVTDVTTFSETANVLQQYTITGLTEVNI